MAGSPEKLPNGKIIMRKAVFLARDGTIIANKETLKDPDHVELLLGAGEALKRLADVGFDLFVVTNQPCVGRGSLTLAEVERVHWRLCELLREFGVELTKIYVAPEAPDQESRGRKPSPQFLFDARNESGIDLSRSYMVGDKKTDLECGWGANLAWSLLVRTGSGKQTEQELRDELKRTMVFDDLKAASEWIIHNDLQGQAPS